MKATTYLKTQIESARYLLKSVLKSLTDEQLAWSPPGTVESIGTIWLHTMAAEDAFISILAQQDKLWDTAGWQATFGLEKYPNMGEDWSTYAQVNLTMKDLQAYTEAVHQQTDAHLAAINDDVLDEKIKFFTDSDPKASVWALLVSHMLEHTGEMAAIKGMQGEQGLPF